MVITVGQSPWTTPDSSWRSRSDENFQGTIKSTYFNALVRGPPTINIGSLRSGKACGIGLSACALLRSVELNSLGTFENLREGPHYDGPVLLGKSVRDWPGFAKLRSFRCKRQVR